MRGVITCSGIIVVIALIVMIHASITGNNIRRDEVNRSLDGAMDFAFDRMGNVTVKLIDSDLDRGLFQIGVTEEYEYPFGGRTGKCYYEKTYSFN